MHALLPLSPPYLCRRELPNSSLASTLFSTHRSFSLSASVRQMLQVCDRDDVSKVTLLAWPGQGYDAIWLSSGLLVQFVFVSVLGYYFASAMFGSLYCIYLHSWLVGVVVVYIFFCGFHRELL